MENCITGEFRARSFSALTNRLRIFSLSLSNRPVSYFARTKDFTTRIPFTFSCTLAFSSSYSWNTRLKVGFALDEIRASTAARQTITTRNIMANPELALDAVLPDSTPNHKASMAARSWQGRSSPPFQCSDPPGRSQ